MQRWTRVTFFGPASNPTHLRLTRDPTRPGFIKMQCAMLLYACKNNMKRLRHFIIALPMFNTRRNRRIHISYKSWTQYTRFVVKVQSHESSRQTDTMTCHCHTTHRHMPERTSSNASIFSTDRRDRISVTVRPTDEKSRSDWVELADTLKKRLAVKDIIGSWSAFCLQNSRGPTAGVDILLYSANSAALVWRVRRPSTALCSRGHRRMDRDSPSCGPDCWPCH